ncbi:hypothetical protein V5E97_04105 [Singulisphaera sp. Ch08]|uniref:Uncharacterized protein n=1 Tax=Singulisphaera sp. Ch08 TaxID=3120278 RepID=A0AAU7CJJ0_9BACT
MWRDWITQIFRSLEPPHPTKSRILQMLWFIKTSHGVPGWALSGLQANRIDGGTGLLSERMAQELGKDVFLDAAEGLFVSAIK